MSVLLLATCKSLKLLNYRALNERDARLWFPVSCLLVLMIYTGSKAIQFLPISLFTIFKNVTIILIAVGDVIMFNGTVTGLMVVSFLLMILSSVLGGYNDLSFNLIGYCWMIVNCLSCAAYVLFMRKCIKLVNFKDFDTVYYNNLLSVPLMIACSWLIEDWSTFRENYFNGGALEMHRNSLFAGILVSSISAFAISYSTAWAIRVTTSTTYSMVGALNKLPIAISGIIFLPSERNVSLGNLSSIAMAFLSGIVYSVAQVRLAAAKKKKEEGMLLHSSANSKV